MVWGSSAAKDYTYVGGEYFYDPSNALLHESANEVGGITCNDLVVVKRQRQAATDVMKEIGRRLIRGSVNLINVSMPVSIFEPRSYLQKLADPWVFPGMLDRAAGLSEQPVERMKWVMSYFLAGMQHVFSTWAKPFNPILGETWQGALPDGSRIMLEQISHHPPTSAWTMESKDRDKATGRPRWQFIGTSNPKVSFRLNSLSTIPTGYRRVLFADGSSVEVTFPSYVINNVFRGTPQGLLTGCMGFSDKQNNIEGVFHFGSVKKASDPLLVREDAVWGGISVMGVQTAKKWYKLHDEGRALGKAKSFRRGMKPRGDGIYSVVTGNWLSHCDFDGVRYWSLHEENDERGYRWSPVPEAQALPSDSRYREDLAFLRQGKAAASQKWKEDLENLQRADKKQRESGWLKLTGKAMPHFH